VLAWIGSAHAAPDAAPAAGGGQLTLLAAIILGAIQGITEFLPISSDGHLALGSAVLGLEGGAGGHRFTITVHAGTLLAVVWTYRTDLLALAKAALRPGAASDDRHLLIAMLVASLPLGFAVMPGVKDAIIAMEAEVRWVGVWLWVSGLALFLGFRHERRHPPARPGTLPTLRQALVIGLAQVTAILPGLSRSGMTISTALLVGLDRAVAARFSFLISVIAVSGAVAKEVLDLVTAPADPTPIDIAPYVAGFVVSLVVGLAALRGLLLIVGKGRVMGFVVYLAILGAVAIAVG
jgi:undecaprenyl-diphosphatase